MLRALVGPEIDTLMIQTFIRWRHANTSGFDF